MSIIRRLLLTLVALIIMALGLAIVVQTVAALFGYAWPAPYSWTTTLKTTQVSDRWVLIASVAVAVLGFLILIAQLIPRRQRRLPTTVGDSYWVLRRAVESRLTAAATRAGVTAHAHADVRGTRDQWRVQVRGDAPSHRNAAVEAAVQDELTGMGAPADRDVTFALRVPGRVS